MKKLFTLAFLTLFASMTSAEEAFRSGMIDHEYSQLGHPITSKADLQRVLSQIQNDPHGPASEYRSDNGVWYLHLTQNVNLDGSEVVVQGIANVTIIGNGYYFYRTQNQNTVRMFNIVGVTGLTFLNVGFDDRANGLLNVPGDNHNMIWVRDSSDVRFENTVVTDSTGYSLYVQNTIGFYFINSIMRNAGILGLYVGHGLALQSQNVIVDGNHFLGNSTNALAFLGVGGEIQNRITDNMFSDNHRAGRFSVAPRFGTGMTGGGQLYIAEADNVLLEGNLIVDGSCSNCYSHDSNRQAKDVHGIELSGLYGSEVRVTRLIITGNTITRNDAYGIYQNQNSTLDDTTKIFGNSVYDNGVNFSVRDVDNPS